MKHEKKKRNMNLGLSLWWHRCEFMNFSLVNKETTEKKRKIQAIEINLNKNDHHGEKSKDYLKI